MFSFPPKNVGRLRREDSLVETSVAAQWAALEEHFREHRKQVERFERADGIAVRHMWEYQTDEFGNHLSDFERDALIERHCELFGTWPR
jgi:hypothetical protein